MDINKISNIKYCYLLNVARNGWFISGTWLFFWLKFVSYSEIGIIDGITVLIAFLLEVPFGALADMIGRKKTLTFAYFAMFLGPLLMGIAQSKEVLIVGNLIYFIGFSAQSGAYDALAYDTLKNAKQESQYPKYYAKVTTIAWATTSLSLIVGGLIDIINPRIPYILWSLFGFGGFLITFRLTDDGFVKKANSSILNYIRQNIDGIKQLFTKKLIQFVPFALVVLGFLYFFDWSFLRPAIGKENGLDGFTQSMLYALSAIPAALAVQLLPFLKRKLSNKLGSVVLCILLAIIFFVFGQKLGAIMGIPMVLISPVSALSYAWMVMIINENVDSAHRATTVSSMFMLLKIPYILLAVLGGKLIESGSITTLNTGIGAVILVTALVLSLWSGTKKTSQDEKVIQA